MRPRAIIARHALTYPTAIHLFTELLWTYATFTFAALQACLSDFVEGANSNQILGILTLLGNNVLADPANAYVSSLTLAHMSGHLGLMG
jgi:hypothetical protein